MIIELFQHFIGIVLVLFLPGFLLSHIIFDKLDIIEIIVFSVAFSLSMSVAVGIFLGITPTIAEITGGITPLNVSILLVILCFFLGITLIFKKKGLF